MADHDDQDDETPGTSSSKACAELSNPITSGTPMLTRSQRAERFTTPLQSNAPFIPELTRIAEENEISCVTSKPISKPNSRWRTRLWQRQQNWRWTAISSKSHLEISEQNTFRENDTSYIDQLLKEKISNKCFNNKRMLQ